ncbi:hypothetical protein PN290_00260 [Romboutsia sp. 1001216sp1]|uniref:hypothetical protein n=1 Tax=unclassified Romboutsia TaxID=2626894 RepID=UPI0018AAF14A|nr:MULTISPECIES: hypothetical protein [unclassified Romboutsia]MDB8794284.1 hypothetical protein [Romboutsia sp. 1001216sp1]MDB8796453.1 hypothetical protein [Romboutsia sp. 1001216sp1]MDB8797794.1 hypothetical protein [Romboutsia sp. 1001216sp1]
MNTAFILNESIYSFKKVDVNVFVNVCNSLDINITELRDKLNKQDLRAIVHMMYYSIRDRKELTIEDMYRLDVRHLELLLDLYIKTNK